MGGDVKVDSELDRGTDFIIDLKTWCLVPKAKLQLLYNNKNISGRLSPRDLLAGRNFQELEKIEEQASHKEKSQLYASNETNKMMNFQGSNIIGKHKATSYETEGAVNRFAERKFSTPL